MTSRRRRIAVAIPATLAALSASTLALSGAASAASAAAPASQPDQLAPNFALAVGPAVHPFATSTGCQLNNGVKHVFYLGFDNVHLRRDNSNNTANNGDDNHNTDLNIPSDIEQVPALYNFLRGTDQAVNHPANNPAGNGNYANNHNTTYGDSTAYPGGTILNDNHTPLISHTSVDFTTTYTGVYGDRHGVAISENNIAAYTGNATTPVQSTSGFSYWTDPLGIGNDTTNVLTTPDGSGNPVNAPAPWVPFTRAGCDVGDVSTTGMVLENTKSVQNAFGASSAEATAVAAGGLTGANAVADYEGIAVHCAQGSAVCAKGTTDTNVKTVTDTLPSEPGGYSGYQAIYGNKYVAPAVNDAINGTATGGTTSLPLIRSGSSSDGFPGFNGEDGNYTLGETLDMQKAGIPITFGYLSDTHDCHSFNWSPTSGSGIKDSRSTMNLDYGGTYTDPTGTSPSNGSNPCNFTLAPGTTANSSFGPFGSGEAGYTTYLSNLNNDFQSFFDQAKAAGYTTQNTEFVFYSDENDHTAETTPVNSTCDGVTVACQYVHQNEAVATPGQLGELAVNVDSLLPARSKQSSQPYFINTDSAPDFYLSNSGSATPPLQTDANVRAYEQDLGSVSYTDPYTGATSKLAKYEADQAELAALHMVTADPARTPTVTAFAPGEDFVSAANCSFTVKNGTTAVPVSASPQTVNLASATTTGFAVGTVVTFSGGATLTLTSAASIGATSLQGTVSGATIAANASGTVTVPVCSNDGFAYVHGDFAPETNNTWAGFAGPGIANNGVDTTTWTDHVDLRPTLLGVLGLTDDYTDDGRVITQILTPGAIPTAGQTTTATDLGTMLKKLNAPVYQSAEGANDGFGSATLVADTTAVQGTSSSTYGDVENRIASITAQRNIVTSDIKGRLTAANVTNTPIDATAAATDISEGQCLLNYANALKGYAVSPSVATAPTDCNIASGTNPALPESPSVALMALAGGVVLAGGLVVAGRRRRRYTAV